MEHRNSVEFEVTGKYGMFADPVTRVGGEKFSYQVPTYEALKGILHSVYWKPTLIWIIDSVRVMNPIQTETKGIRPIKYYNNKNDLSYYTYLKECRYQVKAHFIMNENRPELKEDRNEHKHHNIARRMIERGGRRDIFLGARECQGYVKPCVFGQGEGFYDDISEINFGTMYHGITYSDEAYSEETRGKMSVRFWQAVMNNGVIAFIPPWKCIHRPVREMNIKKFGVKQENFSVIQEEEVM
ncbi:type I-C CRISPR-associated protein Cas5 [Eubacterium sp. am_0171]|uniref:pre-crRNA processing endonuclease n=1 Tax=Faecalicatena contorta TaxID=39482 RepID=A0A174AFI3_9FIRM|nr:MULTISPECIES: type I-C CRISPR-associated protein Cas5c [Clostridia]MSC83625.1 type I-C CRISPR-associated protein Cas5 [Eubacterium sp. BIOML-A1]MSD04664.1 type I-C CRISPR-associated protein Cas5 [Eubacterium sp. BIOML-A2]RYT25841.1 type I-C CRISPR-associated protein Cas5 [Eubacterium sp. am_0171]CUN86246.1 CRISPR-associated protein Cas5%2C subtype I-C/DVULG [[Eubacterium] contortum] [Faecalicatena contorta]